MPVVLTPEEQEALDFLISKYPKRYRARTSVYLQALLSALATGDGYIATQIDAVRDNLLVLTASGKNLDRLASQYGVIRGQGTGVQDADFRNLIPILGLSPKQITHSLQRVVDAIYGPYASHANATCASAAPYDLSAGQSLKIRVDDTNVEVIFNSSDAVNLAAATAQEIATAISEKTSGRVIGSVVSSAQSGAQFVNIRTSTIGSQGFIQVLGGDVQSVLQFPEVRPVTGGPFTWTITRSGSDMLFTSTAGLQAAGVRTGDFVVIRSDSGLNANNCGTFPVTSVSSSGFTAAIPNGVPQSATLTNHADDFTFFNPDLGNILLAARPATVLETGNREITVMLPVTSPIVKRMLAGGHHMRENSLIVSAVTSSTIALPNVVNFPASGAVHVVSSRPHSSGTISSVGSNTVNLISTQGWPTSGAFYSPNLQTFYYYSGISGTTLQNVTPTPDSSLPGSPANYSERYSYSSIVGNVLQGVFPNPASTLGREVAPAGARIVTGYPGSYMYDPKASFIPSQDACSLNAAISQGSSLKVIQTTSLPAGAANSGYFVLEYGQGRQEGPIKYLDKTGTGALIIDPGHIFQFDHAQGVSLRFIRQLGAYAPRTDGTDLAVFMTSTSPARDLVEQYIRDIVAAGITVKFNISVPDSKWPVLEQLQATSPIATSLN